MKPMLKTLSIITLALFASIVAFSKESAAEKQTFVIVHGATAGGWTIRTFPGGHVAQQEDPRGVATLMEKAVEDRNQPSSGVLP